MLGENDANALALLERFQERMNRKPNLFDNYLAADRINGDHATVSRRDELTLDDAFSSFLEFLFEICSDAFFKEAFLVMVLYRQMMCQLHVESTKVKGESDDGREKTSPSIPANIPFYSNEFVDFCTEAIKSKLRLQDDHRLEFFDANPTCREFLIEFVFHFCRWLFVHGYTTFLLARSPEEAAQTRKQKNI
eukprot:TRINITY_DN10121_c0_g1_i1.p1 TRINITY_DN10121_c0_g1~~TRINITY_DN10121_c0_g1_i1.p1  ORF type:complete len:192 (-),score=28.89 TRINITY_DN10121_c0_g1_i1:214-789(-)